MGLTEIASLSELDAAITRAKVGLLGFDRSAQALRGVLARAGQTGLGYLSLVRRLTLQGGLVVVDFHATCPSARSHGKADGRQGVDPAK